MAKTLENLPEEVMIEILSRLPAESLLRFKSVCKSWYALINDPNFVRKHFSNSLHHEHVVLQSDVPNNNEEMENLFSIIEFPFSGDRSDVTDVPFPSDVDFMDLEICGGSHGLICLSSRKAIFLCNPFTREIRKLPPSIICLPAPSWDINRWEVTLVSDGFGYDAESEDFKVVRMLYFVRIPEFSVLRLGIYDLSKDRWREIENPGCGELFGFLSFEMCHEGTCYWWTKDEEGQDEMLRFDMSKEVFDRMSFPGEVEEQRLSCKRVEVLNGSLVLFIYSMGENENALDIWEMEKNECGGVSWSKVLTTGLVFGIGMPLLFVSYDELLMERAKDGQLILYDIKTKKFNELPIKGHQEGCRATFVVESLVSVKGGNK